jgi:hypothetical protein
MILFLRYFFSIDEPEIGNMDEGIVEGSKDASYAEDEFTCMYR